MMDASRNLTLAVIDRPGVDWRDRPIRSMTGLDPALIVDALIGYGLCSPPALSGSAYRLWLTASISSSTDG
jgi:hypothetical protein